MKTKKLTTLALLTAGAMILSYVESMIPSIGIPGVKMGLANIAVIFALYRLGWREALGISLVRVFMVSMLFGSMSALLYSLAG
ncbi:MAG: Gx transporter family protein, partial [Oscillospiraceae bacterium]|nr:Gx transporter family protein [Oscillospiraceae bacterium]